MNGYLYQRKALQRITALIFLTAILSGCSNSSEPNIEGWNPLPDAIVSGGVPKDGIPSVTDPEWKSASEINWLADTALVAGVVINGQAYAYPHAIMDQHEIVNEPNQDPPYTISFCPLTGSSVVFNSTIGGSVKTFGVSGLLLQNNLIMFDRQTDSNWPQLRLQADKGLLINTKLDLIDHTEIEWGSWKILHPGTLLMSRNTGRNPSSYIPNLYYSGYRRPGASPLFPMNYSDSRLKPKIRVLGIYAGIGKKAYPMSSFKNGRKIIIDTIDGEKIAVFGDRESRMIRAFISTVNGQSLTLRLKDGSDVSSLNKVQFIDDETGTVWNIKGNAVEGSLAGEKMDRAKSFIAYWFAWSAFNRDTELWEG